MFVCCVLYFQLILDKEQLFIVILVNSSLFPGVCVCVCVHMYMHMWLFSSQMGQSGNIYIMPCIVNLIYFVSLSLTAFIFRIFLKNQVNICVHTFCIYNDYYTVYFI